MSARPRDLARTAETKRDLARTGETKSESGTMKRAHRPNDSIAPAAPASPDRPTCVDCGAQSPNVETSYALIREAGWRLVRPTGADGRRSAQWRCAKCWGAFKESGKEPKATGGPRT